MLSVTAAASCRPVCHCNQATYSLPHSSHLDWNCCWNEYRKSPPQNTAVGRPSSAFSRCTAGTATRARYIVVLVLPCWSTDTSERQALGCPAQAASTHSTLPPSSPEQFCPQKAAPAHATGHVRGGPPPPPHACLGAAPLPGSAPHRSLGAGPGLHAAVVQTVIIMHHARSSVAQGQHTQQAARQRGCRHIQAARSPQSHT